MRQHTRLVSALRLQKMQISNARIPLKTAFSQILHRLPLEQQEINHRSFLAQFHEDKCRQRDGRKRETAEDTRGTPTLARRSCGYA